MDERLDALLASLHERFDSMADAERDVREFLIAEGFEERRIGEILAIFYGDRSRTSTGADRVGGESPEPLPIRGAAPFRVLGPHERGRFAPDAWGHLLSLTGAGVLSGAELEHVIDRALAHIDGRIALDDLRVLLDSAGDGEGRPPGGGTTIH